ncbi:MAG TPA: hypothetical protein VMI54_02050 [Polyangiaceae bacterium]|nr:hypothetical protein [Polyangiaceae bacterium]
MAACVVAGLLLRTRGLGSIPLWLDEAMWADRMIHGSIWVASIRPIGFMAVSKGLVACFGARELVLRLLPWLAGCGTVLLSVPLAPRLLTHRAAQLLFIAIMAFQPAAIDFSKEFKPYSISLFFHVACLYFALGYVKEQKLSELAGAAGCALLGLFFAQDVVFALPSLYAVLALVALERRLHRHLFVAAGGAALTLGLLLAFYLLVWRGLVSPHQEESYWGKKYDVFFVHHRGGGPHWRWLLDKLGDVAAMPGQRGERWGKVGPLSAETVAAFAGFYRAFWIALAGLGVVRLLQRKRFLELALVVGPLFVVVTFNSLGLWPFGAFRTNLFLVAYSSALAASALDGFQALERFELAPVLLATVLPLVAFERTWNGEKLWAGGGLPFNDLTDTLVRLQGRRHRHQHREPLVLDGNACKVFHFYMKQHPDYRALDRDFEKRFSTLCETDDSALSAAEEKSSGERVWAILASPRARDLAERGHIANLIDERPMPNQGPLLLELGPPPPTEL